MIFTQTMHDLGYPPWIPRGIIVMDSQDDTDDCGHGKGVQNAIERIINEVHKEYTNHAVIVNAKIEIIPGSGHECYNRKYVRVVGDLYLRQVDAVFQGKELNDANRIQ